jgi:hypothetical protein
MRCTLVLGLPALAALLVGAPPSQADVIVRAPFVTVSVGRPNLFGVEVVRVGIPCIFDVKVRKAKPVIVQTVPTPPPPEVIPSPPSSEVPPPPGPPIRALTLAEFSGSFKPAAGSYGVVLVHPVTKAPVEVNFMLPEGTPRKVQVQRRQLKFDYGPRHFVKIIFEPRGGVRVVSR